MLWHLAVSPPHVHLPRIWAGPKVLRACPRRLRIRPARRTGHPRTAPLTGMWPVVAAQVVVLRRDWPTPLLPWHMASVWRHELEALLLGAVPENLEADLPGKNLRKKRGHRVAHEPLNPGQLTVEADVVGEGLQPA